MRHLNNLVVAAAIAGALAGCADPYYPRYGYSQAAYYPASYSYPVGYSYPSNYGYRSTAYDYRNYNGIHPGPERTWP